MAPAGDAVQIRIGRAADIDRLVEIEVAGSTLFAAYGMVNDALLGPMTPADIVDLEHRIAAERLWVGVVEDVVAAYLALGEVDGNAHLLQVTVDPRYGRQRIGQALIEYAVGVAAAAGYARMTMTTYRDVPWNAPYYQALGFRVMPDQAITPAMRAIRDRERAAGLDEWPRVVLALDL